jgi:hypothetical protein
MACKTAAREQMASNSNNKTSNVFVKILKETFKGFIPEKINKGETVPPGPW